MCTNNNYILYHILKMSVRMSTRNSLRPFTTENSQRLSSVQQSIQTSNSRVSTPPKKDLLNVNNNALFNGATTNKNKTYGASILSKAQSLDNDTVTDGSNNKGQQETSVDSSILKKSESLTSVTKKLSSLSLSNRSPAIDAFKRPQSTFGRFLSTSVSTSCNSLEDIVQYMRVKKVSKIVIMAGAGISTASGIPDFRTPGSGLYDNLQQYRIPFPEAIFDLDFFSVNPRPFFTLAKELYPNGRYRPNPIHYFFSLLSQKAALYRIYTQNIDGLERIAGVPPDKLVEAHGTFASATCTRCRLKYKGDDIKAVIDTDQIPRCSVGNCQGIIKPDIVFFGEDLPLRFYSYNSDLREAEMLFVLGTSLEVEPFASIVNAVRNGVPRVLFNMNPVGVFKRKQRAHDVVVKGDLVESIYKFAELLSWKEELDILIETSEEEARLKMIEQKASSPAPPPPHPPPKTSPSKRPPLPNGSKPFNRGFSTHPPLTPIPQTSRTNRRNTKITPKVPTGSRGVSGVPNRVPVGSRPPQFRRQAPPPQPRRRGQTPSSSSSSDTSSSSSSS